MDSYSVVVKDFHAYEGFIYTKWLRSLRYMNDYFKLMDSDSYYRAYRHYVRNILHHPETVTRFAVLTDNHDIVLGFSVVQRKALHFVYVHNSVRQQGIANSLVPRDISVITHLTKLGLVIWSNKHPEWKFNPFYGVNNDY